MNSPARIKPGVVQDLLEALKDCIAFVHASGHPGAADVLKRVRAAIEKAEGRA